MAKKMSPQLSVVIPLYNEAAGLREFHVRLVRTLKSLIDDNYEILYCDDGSTDGTDKIVRELHIVDPHVKLVRLSRNFGKESALSAGITAARGEAILMCDGDGQHPVERIPEFIKKWQEGAQVVIGIRTNTQGQSWLKKQTSRWFYTVFNRVTSQKLEPGSTDFRLIDKAVQQAFVRLPETDRITRGLIDWLGFRRAYVEFEASERTHGTAGYSYRQLVRLGTHSFVSLSQKPLYFFGYLGVFITLLAFIMGAAVFIEQLLFSDPLGWNFTGTAMLAIILVFLVGIVLMSQGMLALYISHIHSQTKQRPLFVIDYENSVGLEKHDV